MILSPSHLFVSNPSLLLIDFIDFSIALVSPTGTTAARSRPPYWHFCEYCEAEHSEDFCANPFPGNTACCFKYGVGWGFCIGCAPKYESDAPKSWQDDTGDIDWEAHLRETALAAGTIFFFHIKSSF